MLRRARRQGVLLAGTEGTASQQSAWPWEEFRLSNLRCRNEPAESKAAIDGIRWGVWPQLLSVTPKNSRSQPVGLNARQKFLAEVRTAWHRLWGWQQEHLLVAGAAPGTLRRGSNRGIRFAVDDRRSSWLGRGLAGFPLPPCEQAGKIEAQLQAAVGELVARPTRRMTGTCRTCCRSPRNLPGVGHVWRRSPVPKATIEARAKEAPCARTGRLRSPTQRGETKAAATGTKPTGRPPAAPVEGRLPTDQVNLTDEETWIMPVAGGGFEQC
jgi:hypothetical protein